jgi:hypothetical protein
LEIKNMKTSQLILALRKISEIHGDLDVIIETDWEDPINPRGIELALSGIGWDRDGNNFTLLSVGNEVIYLDGADLD